MKRLKPVRGLLLSGMLLASQHLALAATINLHNPVLIHDAEQVGQAIQHLSGKVMRCVANNGGKPGHCICRDPCGCRFKQDYAAVSKAFRQALKRHPAWAGNVVFYHSAKQPRGFTVSFSREMQHRFRKRCRRRQ